VHGSPAADYEGMAFARPVGWLGRTRRTLREERNLLDVLLDSLDVAVVACGADGQLTHLDRRAVELMGMDGSTGSDSDTWIERVSPRTPQGLRLSFEELPIVRALKGEVARASTCWSRPVMGTSS
jgi:diguanylate cyclase